MMAFLVLVFPTLLVTALVAVFFYMSRNFNYWKKRNVPYFKPTPIFGNMGPVFTLKKSIGGIIADLHSRAVDEPFTGVLNLDKPSLVVRDLDLIKNIMIKDFSHFTDHSFTPGVATDTTEFQGVFSVKGDRWRRMRTKLTPIFASGKMKSMCYLVTGCAKQLDPLLEEYADSGHDFDAKDVMARFTTDAISACAFGLRANSVENPDSELRRIGKLALEPSRILGLKSGLSIFAPWLLPVFRIKLIPKPIKTILRQIIWSTVKYREENGVKMNDMLDTLLEVRKKSYIEHEEDAQIPVFDGDALVGQTFGFLIAGSESSSSIMCLTLYELAKNIEIQEKLRKSIQKVLAKYDGEITYDAIQEMEYLQQCMHETLRKYPPLPFLERECTKPYQVPGTKLVIESGVKILISVISIQNDPNIFPEPEKYDPDRFTKENVAARHKFAFIPFGEGPRNCIGLRFAVMQMKIGLVHLLRSYSVEPCANTPIPLKFNMTSITLTAMGGIPLTLKKLQCSDSNVAVKDEVEFVGAKM